MSWQWPAQPAAAAWPAAPAAPTPGTQYTPEQWAAMNAMQQQNWQQWMTWQQQYQQWQQQYGEQYAKQMALAGQPAQPPYMPTVPTVPAVPSVPTVPTIPAAPPVTLQPPLPVDVKVAPPLPQEAKPPLPPDEAPQPPPDFNASVPPPTAKPNPPSMYRGPPNYQNYRTPPQTQPRGQSSQSFATNQPPPSLMDITIKSPYDTTPRSDTNKRPGDFKDFDSPKKNRWETEFPEQQNERWQKADPNINQQKRWTQPTTPNKPWNTPQSAGKDVGKPWGQAPPSRNQNWATPGTSNPPGASGISGVSGPPTSTLKLNRPNAEELSEAEKLFDKQFEQWEAQFNKWKDQNQNHPDKQQYKEYEAKWESWRTQLLDRREQMRKKRLGMSSSTKPPQNAQPQQPVEIQKEIEVKEPINEVKDAPQEHDPDISFLFSQPPKEQRTNIRARRPSTKLENENPPTDTSFLQSASASDGIPGLDLVKDEETEEKDEDEEEKKAHPDFEAISKGINTILGDAKLMNMLSLVSQNKNPTTESSTSPVESSPVQASNNTMAPEDSYQSNESFGNQYNDSYSNDRFYEPSRDSGDFNNSFQDRPRDEFRGQQNYNRNSSEFFPQNRNPGMNFNRGAPNNFPQNRGNMDFSNNFDAPQSNFSAPPPNNFPRQTPNNFQGPLPNKFQGPSPNKFQGPPQNRDFNNQFNQNDFNRPFDFNRGPNSNWGPNRNNLNEGNNRTPEFNQQNRAPPMGMPPRGQGEGPRNFNLQLDEPRNFNPMDNQKGFNMDNQKGFNMDNQKGFNMDNQKGFNEMIGRGPIDNFRDGPRGFNEGPRDSMDRGFDNQRGPMNNRPLNNGEFNDGPRNFDNRSFDNPRMDFDRPKGPMDNPRGMRMMDGPMGDNRGQNNMNPWMQNEPNNQAPLGFNNSQNNRNDDLQLRNQGPPGPNRAVQDYDDFRNRAPNPSGPNRVAQDYDDFRNRPNPFGRRTTERNFRGGDMFRGDFRENNSAAPLRGSTEKYWDEALILKPFSVIDYGHKSLAKKETTFIEPVQTFDYNHASKNTDKPDHKQLESFNKYSRYSNSPSRPPQNESHRSHEPPRPPRINFEKNSFNKNKNFERNNRDSPVYNKDTCRFETKRKPSSQSPPRQSRVSPPKNTIEYDDIEDEDPFADDDDDDNFVEDKKPKDTPEKFAISPQKSEPKSSSVMMVEDLLIPPGRNSRPQRIVIMLRGPPGSGKTFLAKLIKDKEVEQGGSAPRILSLDDYFMVETDKEIIEKETGRKTTVKEMVYEYEECMELSYRQSLERAFKKTITDGFFPFIILDCVNDKVKHFSEMWSFAKQNGFQVYVCQMELDVTACTKRNIHHRSEVEIERLVAGWETTPSHYLTLDATSLIQAGCISDVEMEEVTTVSDEEDKDGEFEGHIISKWERMDPSGEKLAKLDGTNKPLRPKTMEDYLQMDDDIPEDRPGVKRVRWADLEERRHQEKIRALGFVVGQTDWNRMLDPTQGSSALTQTKYIERVRRF